VKTKAIFKIDPKLGPITIKSQLINKPCKLPKATTIESER
jgi:hypothetical protein